MQVTVTFRNMDASEGLKLYATEKVEHIRKYIRRPASAHVVLFRERFQHVAEIVMMANGVALKCLARDLDAHAAIDEAIAKLARQARKQKEKRKDHRPPEVRRARRTRSPLESEALVPELLAGPPPPVIVRTEEFAAKPLSPEQAVAELVARDLGVLLFKNARSKRINVVYRRVDGTYGLVEGKARRTQHTTVGASRAGG
jgi:putative sigma-54 modulation protein